MTIEDLLAQYYFFLDLVSQYRSFVTSIVLASFFALAGSFLLYNLARLFLILYNSRKPHSLLSVEPLKETEQSTTSTEQLISVLHAICRKQTKFEKILQIRQPISLELVSSKNQGIRYLIRVEEDLVELIKDSMLSYLPGVKAEVVSDYLSEVDSELEIVEFGLSKHFAYPLKSHEDLSKNDPIAYLAGNMTKLKENELVAFQLVLAPTNHSIRRSISKITQLILAQKDLVSSIDNTGAHTIFKLIVKVLLKLLLLPLGIFIFLFSRGEQGPWLGTSSNTEVQKTPNPYQQELEKLIKGKLEKPLFQSSIRLAVVSTSLQERTKRRQGFSSALSSVSDSGYQSLVPILRTRFSWLRPLKSWLFKHRIITPLTRTILSINEVSDLYHFPFTRTTKTEDLQKQHSRELPAPVTLKRANSLDVVFAQNTYGGSTTAIGLTEDERRRHMYILGATGTGKSTMLLSMINSDIQNNKGLAVIDPHGDLIEQILHIIPEDRIEDVIYFNPDDIEYPIGINLLELSEGLSKEDAVREKEFITESIISLFHKIYTERYSGPRMEYILRNTIHTAFTVPNATLFTVYKLLINTKFRKSVVKNLTDENLKDFWKYEFAKAGDYQKVSMISPITNKIGRFLFSSTTKRILEQEKSTINFDEIMDERKILLCNLSKGKLGEDNSEVLGVVIMAKLQLAALKRARQQSDDRKDFYLYVDEFQNFATPAFAQILSEARKYKLNAILAHQTTSQLEDKSLVNVTLANTGTVICFRTANPADEKIILPQFKPAIEPGEIASLPSYRFYMRLGAMTPEEPFSGVTLPVSVTENSDRVNSIVEASRANYANKYAEPIDQPNNKKVAKKKLAKNRISHAVLP